MKKPICIYVDNSNIYIGAQNIAPQKNESRASLRIHFKHFMYLITHGERHFDELIWGGSIPPANDIVWDYVRQQGVEPELIPRSESGENDTVDQALQLQMYRHVRKYRENPGTIILCTGDGKGFAEEKGFLFDAKGFVEDGWDLKLCSWDDSCHHRLRTFAEENGQFLKLDDHYDEITFVQEGRKVKKVVL